MLRLWQYLANSSLWIDELALTRNIIDRPAAGLLAPLDYAQVAPLGFLFVEKGITTALGNSEYALRAFPLVCGLASLLLFWGVARRILSGWAVPFAVGLFSLGIPFIYFSSQVKQYSSDVAAALVMLLAVLEIRHRGVTVGRSALLGIGGALVAWFSQPAVIVLAGIGAGLFILTVAERNWSGMRSLSITWMLWAASAAAVTVRSMHSVPPLDREYFRWFWADGFMPMPPHSISDLLWLPRKLLWVFGQFELGLGRTDGGLSYRWSPVFALVMAWGFWALWRKQRDAALFLVLPVVLCAGLSAAAVYPFTARVIAFLIPSFIVATAAGTAHILRNLPDKLQFLSPVVMAVLGGAPVYASATALPPSWLQHVRPVIQHVHERLVPGDTIFVFYSAGPAFGYYAPRLGIPAESVISGRCRLADPRGYLRELDRLRGSKRVWVIATHLIRTGELDMVTGYLDRIGHRLDVVIVPGSRSGQIEGAYGYLYDLSDPSRLASTTAETFGPVLTPVTNQWRFWGCYGVIDQPRY